MGSEMQGQLASENAAKAWLASQQGPNRTAWRTKQAATLGKEPIQEASPVPRLFV